jgi:hypothetical protein
MKQTSKRARFLLRLFFDPDDGGDMFFRNVGFFAVLNGVIAQKTEVFKFYNIPQNITHSIKSGHVRKLYKPHCLQFLLPSIMQQFFDTIHTLFTKMLVKTYVIKIYLQHVSTSMGHLQVTLFSFYIRDLLYCTHRRSYVVIYYF